MTGPINYAAAQARHATSTKHVALESVVEALPRKSRSRRSLIWRRQRAVRAYAA
jgi:hypothetical protein